jgi:hypothetical protein
LKFNSKKMNVYEKMSDKLKNKLKKPSKDSV